MKVDWIFILVVAVNTVGLLQWLKQLLEKVTTAVMPAWLFPVLMPIFAIGLSLLQASTDAWVGYGLMGLSVAQLAYENIVKLVQKKVEEL